MKHVLNTRNWLCFIISINYKFINCFLNVKKSPILFFSTSKMDQVQMHSHWHSARFKVHEYDRFGTDFFLMNAKGVSYLTCSHACASCLWCVGNVRSAQATQWNQHGWNSWQERGVNTKVFLDRKLCTMNYSYALSFVCWIITLTRDFNSDDTATQIESPNLVWFFRVYTSV